MRSPRHRRARTLGLALAGVVAVAACGNTESTGTPDTLAPAATFETNDSTSELDVGVAAEPADTEPAGAEAAPPASDPTQADAQGDAAPATEVPAEPAEAAPAVQPAVLGGRALDEAVTTASQVETNLLPDLVVDDVGRQTKVNLRNVFPADRPVLLWMWAPH